MGHVVRKERLVERITLTCQRCGCAFERTPAELRGGRGKYCGRECSDKKPIEGIQALGFKQIDWK